MRRRRAVGRTRGWKGWKQHAHAWKRRENKRLLLLLWLLLLWLLLLWLLLLWLLLWSGGGGGLCLRRRGLLQNPDKLAEKVLEQLRARNAVQCGSKVTMRVVVIVVVVVVAVFVVVFSAIVVVIVVII